MTLPRDKRCERCGAKLDPCPARWDGEPTYVGYYPCKCRAKKDEGEDA